LLLLCRKLVVYFFACAVFREGEDSGCLYVVLSGEYAMFSKVAALIAE
jgi:hypothetical protein